MVFYFIEMENFMYEYIGIMPGKNSGEIASMQQRQRTIMKHKMEYIRTYKHPQAAIEAASIYAATESKKIKDFYEKQKELQRTDYDGVKTETPKHVKKPTKVNPDNTTQKLLNYTRKDSSFSTLAQAFGLDSGNYGDLDSLSPVTLNSQK